MDSRSGFALVLAALGIAIAWAAVTGNAQKLLAAAKTAWNSTSTTGGTTTTGSTPPAQTTASTPQQTLSGSPTTAQNVGAIVTTPSEILSAMQYGNLLGTDGIKATPYVAPAATA